MADHPPFVPTVPTLPDDPALLADIVAKGAEALAKLPSTRVSRFGENVWCFSTGEHEALTALQQLVAGYLKIEKPKRPLCLAVFGPPGSGKSFGVEELGKALAKDGPCALPQTTINLTRVPSTAALARELKRASDEAAAVPGAVPFVFFDEFDCALDGSPLGWLSWFLAPMQDAKFTVDDAQSSLPRAIQHVAARLRLRRDVDCPEISLPRAIYVFAGGTASSLEAFERQSPAPFRAAKGPDFVSRLRGYLDVLGPNAPHEQGLRRAFALHNGLNKVGAVTKRTLVLSDTLRSAMLRAGRFRHGQRSVEALIEMTAAHAKSDTLDLDDLPADHIVQMHADRGPLDPAVVGGLVGLSIGWQDLPSGRKSMAAPKAAMDALVVALWELGATVSYAGKWNANGLIETLVHLLGRLPTRLSAKSRADTSIRMAAFVTEKSSAPENPHVEVVMVAPVLSPAELGQAASYFRKRWQGGCRCVARVLMAGKTEKYSGRMPGILEEAMVALALKQPVYVLGGFGGAAAALGHLLGLADREVPPVALGPNLPIPAKHAHLFRPSTHPGLPLTLDETQSWLASHAIGGPGWTYNGLDVKQNRELFRLGAKEGDPERAVALIKEGLLRLFPA